MSSHLDYYITGCVYIEAKLTQNRNVIVAAKKCDTLDMKSV